MSDRQPGGFCCNADRSLISCDGLHGEADLEAWRGGRLYAWTCELIEVVRAEGIEGRRCSTSVPASAPST